MLHVTIRADPAIASAAEIIHLQLLQQNATVLRQLLHYLNSFNRWQFIKKLWSTEKILDVFIDADVFKQWTLKQCLQ